MVTAVGCQSGAGADNAPATGKESSNQKEPVKAPVDGQLMQNDQFSFVVPKSWKAVDLTKASLEEALASLKGDPLYEQVKAGAGAVQYNKQVKYFVFDPEHSVPGFGSNLNVMELPIPAGTSSKQVFDANAAQLKAQTKQDVKFAEFKAGKADAGRIDWTMPMQGKELHLTTVIAVANNNQYVFTFTTPKEKAEAAASSIDGVVKTIEFK